MTMTIMTQLMTDDPDHSHSFNRLFTSSNHSEGNLSIIWLKRGRVGGGQEGASNG